MNRKTLTAVAAFALLGLVAFFALRQPEKGEGSTDRQRPIAKIDPASYDTLTITRQGATTTLVREGGKVKVTSPVAYPADEFAGKGAFDAIDKLELGNLVTENKAKHAEFEVDDAKGIHVVASKGQGGSAAPVVNLLVGKSVGNGTMVRLAGKDEVWQATASIRGAFDKAPGDFRDKTVTTFSAPDAEMITVKAKDGTVAILKKNGKNGMDDKWDVVTGNPKLDKLDMTVPNGLVQALSSFKANDFADGVTPAAAGLDAPALTVTVAVKGGKNVTLLIGNKKDDGVYVKTPDAPQVYVAKNFNIDRINKRPADFRDKSLTDIGEADLAEVAVTHGADSYTLVHAGSAWKATKPPKFELDPSRTPAIGGAFKDWKATSFAENPSPAATGLAKPKAVVAIKTTKKESLTFKIGDETADKQGVYLQTSKSPEVYVVPKWSTDRLLVTLADLKKK